MGDVIVDGVFARAIGPPEGWQRFRSLYVNQFTSALGGKPVEYRWTYIPEGSVWYEVDGEEVLADEDLVEVSAFRERRKE